MTDSEAELAQHLEEIGERAFVLLRLRCVEIDFHNEVTARASCLRLIRAAIELATSLPRRPILPINR